MDLNSSLVYPPIDEFLYPENFTYGNFTPHNLYFPYPGKIRVLGDGEKAGKIIAYLVIFIVAIVGNCLVIYTVAMNKKMRTTTNFYLTNLAVADILIAVCCMWVALIKDLTDPVWIFGDFMCRFNTFMQGVSITSSIIMLTVIAIDRFYAIIFPLKARITETNTAAVISTVWLISCAVNVPLLVVSEQKQWQWQDGVLEVWCTEKWDQHQKAIYTSVLFVVLYVMPLAVMMVAYFLLARKLWRTTSPGIAALSIQQLQLKAKKKVIKMLVVVMTVFFVCWTPYHILQIWLQFGTLPKESPPYFKQLRFVVLLLGYSNSAMNPIIYAGVNENFRKSFWDAYKCKHCRRNQVQPDEPAVWLEHPHDNIETQSTQAPQELRVHGHSKFRA